jgi:hypothetical protein
MGFIPSIHTATKWYRCLKDFTSSNGLRFKYDGVIDSNVYTKLNQQEKGYFTLHDRHTSGYSQITSSTTSSALDDMITIGAISMLSDSSSSSDSGFGGFGGGDFGGGGAGGDF